MDFIEQINKVFQPAHEIKEPNYFIGRKNEIHQSILALRETGSFLVVYGNRGVGKSSVARQVQLIAQGDRKLAAFMSLENLLPHKGFDFIVSYVFCDKYTKDVVDLIKRITYGDQHGQSLFDLTGDKEGLRKKFERTVKVNGGANVGVAKVETAGEETTTYESISIDETIQQFKTLLGLVRAQNSKKSGL